MDITSYLKKMVEKGASDLFLSVGTPAQIKIEGVMHSLEKKPLNSDELLELAQGIMNDEHLKTFESTLELNHAISIENVGRFRINIFKQRGEMAMAIRYIKAAIPSIESLSLPPILKKIILERQGLVLIVGSTGSGKSTTLASMIDYRNQTQTGHILLIEEPIEFIHEHQQSIVNQREVGLDTLSVENALLNAMRESPDVIAIGEIRDANNMKYALHYAETGHLCLATLHANNANHALERIVHFFPEHATSQYLLDLSLNLKAIIALRLIPGISEKRVPAVEILLNTPHIADLIAAGKIDDIKEVMSKSLDKEIQTFDEALYQLYRQEKISLENAIRYADSKNNLSLRIRLSTQSNGDEGKQISLTPDKKPGFYKKT